LLVSSVWGTYVSNRWSINAGEAVIAICDGSDMYGYSLVGDWERAHLASDPPRGDRVFEVLQHVNFCHDPGRPCSFLLTAAGGYVRRTSCIFAYDWTTGVVLCAAVMGLGGLFARRPIGLALLLAGFICSAWMTTARCGYFAKTLAYPGCLMLAAL